MIAKTEHPWYHQAGNSGQVLTIKEAYLHCDGCNKLCTVEKEEVIYMCQMYVLLRRQTAEERRYIEIEFYANGTIGGAVLST